MSDTPAASAKPAAKPASRAEVHGRHETTFWPLVLGAIGVVYGDIGTSPLYAFKECFTGHHPIPVTHDHVLGVLSLILWSLISVVSVKYLTFVMRADNEGEGGVLALLARIPQKMSAAGPYRPAIYVLPLLFGASLLYGDGIITPAISVLSAMEGLKFTPSFEPWIVPATCVIISVLFLAQRFGTAGVGRVFGPIMVLWFITLAVFGMRQILVNPSVLEAVDPRHALRMFFELGPRAFLILGSVVLCITGGEALYADMGHFGRRPIQLAWYGMVLPSLVINYFGQGALVLADPAMAANPFYGLIPDTLRYPVIGLATLAAVIASQALISGVYSLTNQATQLGFWPRVNVVHTSVSQEGQIYLPGMNYAMLVACLWLVLSFRSATALASAYGIALTITMIVTSLGFFAVTLRDWKWPLWRSIALLIFFLVFDLAFFAGNVPKIADGGWVPLAIGAAIFIIMTTWRRGRRMLAEQMRARSISLDEFMRVNDMATVRRVPGTAVFLTSSTAGVPPVLRHHFEHNQILHEQVVLLSIQSEDVPFVSPRHRLQLEELPHGFFRLVAHFGFMETPKVPAVLEACAILGMAIDPDTTSYYLGRESLLSGKGKGMARWRKQLFAFTARNSMSATAYFNIPPNRVVEMGMQIEL
jgi:KUP system potassium uptake protein